MDNYNYPNFDATVKVIKEDIKARHGLIRPVLYPSHTFEDYFKVRKLVNNKQMSANTILHLSKKTYYQYFYKNISSTFEITLLQLAMRLNDADFFTDLIGMNVDITLRAPGSELPLMTAILMRNELFVLNIVSAGANVNLRSDVTINGRKYFYTPVEFAVIKNEPKILGFLISRGGLVNIPNPVTKISPLYLAVQHSSYEALETLLSWDANVDKTVAVKRGSFIVTETALSAVIKQGLNIEAFKKMLSNLRLNVNFIDSMKYSYLHYAIFLSGNPKMVACLLDAGVDISVPDGEGDFPVEYRNPNDETCQESVHMIKKHIVKMIVADFNVIPENMKSIHNFTFGRFPIECYDEINSMKEYTLYGTDLNCKKLLHLSLRQAAKKLEEVDFTKPVTEEINQKFPIYAGMINYRLDRAQRYSQGHYS